jgi:4-hydroxy-2-oxoheptanedioate aldolase
MSVARQVRFGGWLMLSDPIGVEAVGRSGVDFVGIDLQHGAFDLESAMHALQLLDLLGVPTLVRVSQDELFLIPRVCDQGASGIIVAMTRGAREARAAVEASRYQPDGWRSYGGQRYGLRPEGDDPTAIRPAVIVMIEDRRGLDALDDILAVPDLGGVHIGPVDLGFGLGIGFDRGQAVWRAAVERIRDATHAVGLPVGIHAVSGEDAARWAADGFDEVVIASDVALLRGALAREVGAARGVRPTLVSDYGSLA